MDFHITKSWMHHGKNRARAIWNHTRQLLPFPRVPVTPLLFLSLFFLDPKLPPVGATSQENREMLLGKVTCSVAVKRKICSSHLPLLIKTPKLLTTPPICYNTCTSQSWVLQEYLAENNGSEPELWPLDDAYPMPMKLASHKELCASNEPAWPQTGAFPEERSSWFAGNLGFSAAIYHQALTSH